MVAQLVYAIISKGVVKNIIVASDIETAQTTARSMYGKDAFAIQTTYIPCNEGDVFENNTFYRYDEEGNLIPIKPLPTEQEEISELKEINQALVLALADMIGGNE